MHRPLIILASFICIGFALFYFQPGVDQTPAAIEISSVDDASTFAPQADTTTAFLPALESDFVDLSVPSFTIDSAPVSMAEGELVMSSDVLTQVQDQAIAMPIPQGLSTQSISSAAVVPDRPRSNPTQLASTAFDVPSLPGVDGLLAAPEVTRAAAPRVIEANPLIGIAPQAQPEQPTLTATDVTSGVFENLGERPLLLTATISASGVKPMPFETGVPQTNAASQADIVTASIQSPSAGATLAPLAQIAAPSLSQTPAVVAEEPARSEILGRLTTHTVRPGDSLTKMAILYYGDKEGYVYIFDANRDTINQPEQISVGQTLNIPLVAAYQ